MQFTLNIIAAILAVSTSTVVADCVVASGSWPAVDQELNKGNGQSQPFVICFLARFRSYQALHPNVGPDPTTSGVITMQCAYLLGMIVIFGKLQILTDGE